MRHLFQNYIKSFVLGLICTLVIPLAASARDKDEFIDAQPMPAVDAPSVCFSNREIQDLAKHFEQINAIFLSNSHGNFICTKELGGMWTIVIQTLLDIKSIRLTTNLSLSKKLQPYRAFDSDWWTYFTDRARSFDMTGVGCSTGTMAYVSRVFAPGVVNICADFFRNLKINRVNRIAYLMHEIRHLESDSYKHSVCDHGDAVRNETLSCDKDLALKGGYAVQLQVLLALGLQAEGFTSDERAYARTEAINLLLNRFNTPPPIDHKPSLYVETNNGDVYIYSPRDKTFKFLKQLPSPARLYSAGIETIVYPLATTEEAYRKSEDFKYDIQRLGMSATIYNQATSLERETYLDFGYGGIGGILLSDNKIKANCRYGPYVDTSIASEYGNIVKFSSLQLFDRKAENFFINEHSEILRPSCEKNILEISHTGISLPLNVRKTVVLGNQTFALLITGELYKLVYSKNSIMLGAKINFKEKIIDMTERLAPTLLENSQITQ
jgi:hypothetical protein